jgi:hypothetical protein
MNASPDEMPNLSSAPVEGDAAASKPDESFSLAALSDSAVVFVTPETFASFQRRLDAPAVPSPALIKTMRSKAPWE